MLENTQSECSFVQHLLMKDLYLDEVTYFLDPLKHNLCIVQCAAEKRAIMKPIINSNTVFTKL